MCQQFSTYLFLFLGLCKTNQECIKLRDCPYTKKLLTKVFSSSSRAEKNNLIAEIRKLICKPSDRSVCCDIEEETEAKGDHEEQIQDTFSIHARPKAYFFKAYPKVKNPKVGSFLRAPEDFEGLRSRKEKMTKTPSFFGKKIN